MGSTKGRGKPRTPAGKYHAALLQTVTGLIRDCEVAVASTLSEMPTDDERESAARFDPRPKGFRPKRVFASKEA